ncbi:T9SS type A sorting domain-containing protein [Pedobacter sp. ASV28]|uniref:T9SS type A sorting domain-containing protein n=1 Tax=Pedobacter sp. ASV28 TaxID=2795123 RepID=UPI0018EB7418|nr:T9SS type A sorting domain-containing protein [Pedobacter sp. ASV28]
MKKLYLIFIFLALTSLSLFAQTVRYVKPLATGTGDGSSWTNASADLQGMINASASGDEVWVAAGTYKPTEKISSTLVDGTTSTTDRDMAFILRTGVKIYGGFLGDLSEVSLNNRNYISNITILSGDLGAIGDKTDNAYHIITARISDNGTEKAILDGFTIQDGYANGTGTVTAGLDLDQNQGAAINLRGSAASGKIEFRNLMVKNNEGTGAGGAAYLYTSGSGILLFNNVQFLSNKSGTSGGAIYITRVSGTTNTPSFTLESCTFSENEAASTSGAIYYSNSSTGLLNILNTKFLTNKSNGGVGGAIYLASGIANIYNGLFYNNESSSSGGAVYVSAGSSGVMTTATIINCTFYQNKASNGSGGAISFFANAANSTIALYNNIFNGNISTSNYADIRASVTAILTFKNNLFQVYAMTAGSDDSFSNNIVNASPTKLFASTSSSDVNFLRLVEGAATQKGDNALIPVSITTDLGGNPRIADGAVDLGAYEFQGTLPVTFEYFKAKKEGSSAILSWKTLNESNSQKFTLERSSSLNNFTVIKTIASIGNTDEASLYNYTDSRPLSGTNYYRLTQYDNDGKPTILGIEALTFGINSEKTTIYPNPANAYVWVKSPSSLDGIISLNLISLTGKIVLTKSFAQVGLRENVKLDLAGIPTGAYILWINKGGAHAQKQTLLVVK